MGPVAQLPLCRAGRESDSWSERSKTLLAPGSEDKRGRGHPKGRGPCDGLWGIGFYSYISLRITTLRTISITDSHLEQERAKRGYG